MQKELIPEVTFKPETIINTKSDEDFLSEISETESKKEIKDYFESRLCGIMETKKIKNDNENTIGKNIRRLRKEKGLGQTDLVKELQLLDIGITRETLVKIERGIQHIQLAQLKGIKQMLDVSYEDLLD